ncbi:MAG: hypothetical protein PUI35_03155, partial [Oscillibacter sp.]|nr:hypothetical protein [Oscillibacter sp.]
FLLPGFMFQLIARHLLHTLNIIVVESFTTPHHYCPMSVQPLPALTVTFFETEVMSALKSITFRSLAAPEVP